MHSFVLFSVIGITGGIAAGLFGIGGGVILVPALVYLAGFSQKIATGTTVAVLLPPIGLAATLEYWRHGNIDIQAAAIIALTMFVGSWLGAHFANQLQGPVLSLAFGIFICVIGFYIIYDALVQMGWL